MEEEVLDFEEGEGRRESRVSELISHVCWGCW